MSTHRLIIELSPSRVEVAVLRGKALTEWRAERIGRAEWPSPYTTALPECSAALTRILEELNVRAGSATVIYTAPGSVSAVTSFASTVGSAACEQGSLLALANVADFPLDDAPSDTCAVFTDSVAKGTKDQPGPVAQRHILAAADAEVRAAAIAEAVEAAGLKVSGLIPAESVCLTDAILSATGAGEPGDMTAIVWIGEHCTSLAVAEHGRLLFVRAIATGTESLADVLCRPLRPRAADAQPVQLAHEAARAMLFAVGVPAPDATIPNHPTLAGSSLLPHLQPVLQRLSIEIKQSLRFGVAEGDRTKVRLRLAGPGAAVPGLGESIARAAGFPFDAPSEAHAPDGADSSTGGTIAALARCPVVSCSLKPAKVRDSWELQRSRKALIAGALVALAYVGYEAVDCRLSMAAEKSRLAAITSTLQSNEGPIALRQQALTCHQQVVEAERRARKRLDQTAEWSAMLESIAQCTPLQVRITGMDMRQETAQNTAVLTLKAYIRAAEAPDPAQLIHTYVGRLEAVPIVSAVRLISAQRVPMNGHDSQSFDLAVNLVPIPALADSPRQVPIAGAAAASEAAK